MKIRYFRIDNEYVAVTDEATMGGTVYVGKGPTPGCGIVSIREQAYSVWQIEKWPEVEPWDVPAEWMQAFGYESPVPAPAPVEAEPVEIDVTWWPFDVKEKRAATSQEQLVFLAGILCAGLYCLIFCR